MIGPVFTRELAIAPRRPRLYLVRAGYAAALLVLMCTAWLVLTGTQSVRDLGDLARFGMMCFQVLAPLQLVVAMFSSALLAASAVAQEKDRRTLVLLLLTHLSNSDLVLGKLLASLLSIFVMLAAALPVFLLLTLFGGVSPLQIGRVFAVTLVAVLACGSLGSTLALWREKTFQSLAMTVLALVAWLAAGELLAAGVFGAQIGGISCEAWAVGVSPWRAILDAARPLFGVDQSLGLMASPLYAFLVFNGVLAVVFNGLAMLRLRVWNPSREEATPVAGETAAATAAPAGQAAGAAATVAAEVGTAGLPTEKAAAAAPAMTERPTRAVWDNPVLWREVRTWAYGRKILLIRVAYLALFALAAAALHAMLAAGPAVAHAGAGWTLVALMLLSLVLVNAQAVTSMTSERDARALDVLLVTDLTSYEVIFGKLGGALYNTKEMILLPMLLCGYVWLRGGLDGENLVYVVGGLAVLVGFVAVLGLHAGINYENSRNAVAVSLGTVFFLFLGVATCMRIMIAFSGSFQAQLLPFTALFFVGGLGLYVALGARNPSAAIGLAAFLCPFATFYGITSYLLGATLGVFLVTVCAYGFATAAMLVPALYEFDVATGRTTVDE